MVEFQDEQQELALHKMTHQQYMEGLATTVTIMTRHSSLEADELRHVSGTVWVTGTCVVVRWPWSSFPAAQLALESFLLISTIVAGRRRNWRKDWKSSPLALLYHVLENPGTNLAKQGEMYDEAKRRRFSSVLMIETSGFYRTHSKHDERRQNKSK